MLFCISVILLLFLNFDVYAKTVYVVPFMGREDNDLQFRCDLPKYNTDDLSGNFYVIREALYRLGYQVKTVASVKNLTDVEAIICLDIPLERPGIFQDLEQYPKEKRIVFIFEPPTVKPYNYDKQYHAYFGKIYTIMDDLVDNKTYFKFYEVQPTLDLIKDIVPFNQKKLCVMLSGGNHASPHPWELYSERYRTIEFFEKNAPSDFDLYGDGWGGRYKKLYKGIAATKLGCLKNYKFCICYENMQRMNGYITGAKILYCFVTGCVPVYWGAPNVTDYIPKNCFIDRRDFKDNSALYRYLKNMTRQEYDTYLKHIKEYLTSPQVVLFSREYSIDIFIRSFTNTYDWSIAYTQEQRTLLQKLYDSQWAPAIFDLKMSNIH